MRRLALSRRKLQSLGLVLFWGLSFFASGWCQGQSLRNGQEDRSRRLTRQDSYFGVHFDFHAELTDKNIGQNTTPEMVNSIIDLIGPDYIEIDTKGHPGVSSYPTRIGNHGGSFVGDPLKVWREVTAQRGVALYGHHSGVWDMLAMRKNPQWCAVNPDGTLVDGKSSVFGPYADRLLIPQLAELAVDYKLDGAWIDGDCWATVIDYSDAAKNAFTRQTGIETIPKKPDDPNWLEWTQFHREAFRAYVRHYLAEVRKTNPDFQMCSNWAFTEHMPDPVNCDVDFISGDIGSRNCVNICRYNSRFMASQDIAWDLMSWSFYEWQMGALDPPKTRKPAVQLMREAACVIAQGGGYQAVFSQAGAGTLPLRDGSVDLQKLKPMGEVGKFCRARQEVCFKAKPVPQVAVLCSTGGTYRKWSQEGDRLFQLDGWQRGIVSSLLENQYAVDVLVSQKLSTRLHEYPLIVVCQWAYIEPDLRDQIVEHVKQGGKLLLIGEASVELFSRELAEAKAKKVAQASPSYSLTFYAVGKGLVGAIPQTITGEFIQNPNAALRDLVGAAVGELFPEPLVTVTGSHDVDVSIMRTPAGELAVHLVNTSGPHRVADLIQSIEPVGPLSVVIRSERNPKSVRLEPGKRACDFSYRNGKIYVAIDKVEIHDIIVIDE